LTFRFLLLSICLGVAACSFPGSVKTTIKIGLSAPFEGLYRDVGYEALYAVRLAVRQRNDAGGVGSRYLVELVALNDFNEAEEAILQAREMAADPNVLGVLGAWSEETARAATPEYRRLGLALLAPEGSFPSNYSLESLDTGWVEEYRDLAGGQSPGPVAMWAHRAANRLLDALHAATVVGGEPTRAGVQAQLSRGRD
jgi:hypothetical protein